MIINYLVTISSKYYLCMVNKKSDKIITWIRINGQFIDQDNIRSIKREGDRTRISLIIGSDIIAPVEYDKVKQLLPSEK